MPQPSAMAHPGLHEARETISQDTLELHRALASLQEELEAIDWYGQRAGACADPQLQAVLLHNLHDEMEHAAMLLEWLRRSDPAFDCQLRSYLFTEAPIAARETEADAASEQADSTRVRPDAEYTIGTLKE